MCVYAFVGMLERVYKKYIGKRRIGIGRMNADFFCVGREKIRW